MGVGMGPKNLFVVVEACAYPLDTHTHSVTVSNLIFLHQTVRAYVRTSAATFHPSHKSSEAIRVDRLAMTSC